MDTVLAGKLAEAIEVKLYVDPTDTKRPIPTRYVGIFTVSEKRYDMKTF